MQRIETDPDRLKRLRKAAGIGSGAELARLAGIPEATYRAYEAGRRPLTPRAARQLAQPLGISWQELLFGSRDLGSQGQISTLERASVELDQKISRKNKTSTFIFRGKTPTEIVSMAGDTWALLPVYDARASAGPGSSIESDVIVSRIAFREDWIRSVTHASIDNLAVIEVDGDSMEPTLRQGDTVLVDFGQCRPQRKDGIYVIRTDGGLQIKRLQIELATGRVSILSDNKAYQPQHGVNPDDLAVVGRVIWLGRQIGS